MTDSWVMQVEIDKTDHTKALYVQIADEVIRFVKNGLLKAGDSLPGTRQLSAELGVNRNTIVRAFEILISEGWLISEERKGIFVSDKLSITQSGKKKEVQQAATGIFRNDQIVFDDGLPDTTCAPIEELARSYRRIFSRKARWQIMNIVSELGDERFRETISKMLNAQRGMKTSVPEICITRGSQMAFFLTAHCLLEKGDNILIENPGFRPAWNTFLHAGANLIPIPVDKEGIDVDTVERILKKKKIKAILLTPHHQYPTTVTLSLSRRLRLIELSNLYNFTIIEDDYDNDFHFGQRPVMPISAHDELNNYVYIGTLSKLIAPAVRIGYVVSSPEFIVRIGNLRKIIDIQGDAIMEQSILDLMVSGEIRRHQKRMITYYEKKRDFFANLIDTYLGDKFTYKKPDGGLAFWLQPTQAIDLFKLNEKANAKGVGFFTPDRFSFSEVVQGIRLGYASLSEVNLEKGIRILGN